MKHTLGIGIGIVAAALTFTGLAQAADMPVKGVRPVIAYYNWTGLYAGINGGYGFGTSNWTVGGPPASIKPKGGMLGGTIGYNWQAGSIVYGIEEDLDWSWVEGSAACAGFTCSTRNKWYATARGRIGYAFDRWLPYITAGGAFGSVGGKNTAVTDHFNYSTRVGWVAGAGLEYAFLGNWSAKVEYLYMDLGNFSCDEGCTGGVKPGTSISFKESMVRVGLNYKFSGPIFSRY
jgi:outer membrane immunogenic protein